MKQSVIFIIHFCAKTWERRGEEIVAVIISMLWQYAV